jgi:hypothetical protein
MLQRQHYFIFLKMTNVGNIVLKRTTSSIVLSYNRISVRNYKSSCLESTSLSIFDPGIYDEPIYTSAKLCFHNFYTTIIRLLQYVARLVIKKFL